MEYKKHFYIYVRLSLGTPINIPIASDIKGDKINFIKRNNMKK